MALGITHVAACVRSFEAAQKSHYSFDHRSCHSMLQDGQWRRSHMTKAAMESLAVARAIKHLIAVICV